MTNLFLSAACTSMVRNDSLDNPLLVANGTYVFTAANCVMCKCDAANNWTWVRSHINSSASPYSNSQLSRTWFAFCLSFDAYIHRLQCEPTQLNSSLWQSCPSTQCQGAQLMSLGNSTSAGCNRTSCAYAGYTNQTILTTLVPESTCPGKPMFHILEHFF